MPPRQARLRASFSDWYARITPGQWHHALWVREKTLANLREGQRVLSDTHFEFQGGHNSAKGVRRNERRMLREKELVEDVRRGPTDRN